MCDYLFFFFFSSRRRHTRLQGDWSSDVCSSDLRQQFAQARASHLRLRLSKLSSVKEDDIPRDRVGFGSRVTVLDVDTKKRETYALTLGEFIEGDDDPAELPVSMASPLGKALLGGKVGQTVGITLPLGKRRLKIVELETVHDLAEKRV